MQEFALLWNCVVFYIFDFTKTIIAQMAQTTSYDFSNKEFTNKN